MYINFFPGDTRDTREICVNAFASAPVEDIVGFVESIISGQVSSALVDGAKDALEDGAIWVELSAKYGERAVQDALEELHNLVGWTEFSHNGRRWLFDADQLAEWDEDEKVFMFHSFHRLAAPTIESLIAYIER